MKGQQKRRQTKEGFGKKRIVAAVAVVAVTADEKIILEGRNLVMIVAAVVQPLPWMLVAYYFDWRKRVVRPMLKDSLEMCWTLFIFLFLSLLVPLI